jgi:homoprotocatechuate degradation regulator HpaR
MDRNLGETQAKPPNVPGSAAGGGTGVRLREFSRSLPMALLRARESVMRHFRPSLSEFDLTEQQWRVLRALSSFSESEVTQLAHATCLLAPSLSRILKDLEKRGLIARRRHEKDMRMIIVCLSATGMKLIERVGAYSEEIYAKLSRRVGEARLMELMKLLRELEEVLGKGTSSPRDY